MARSRNIKPGFFANDELAECEPLARLLFAGLWTEADREGRLEDRPKKIKAAILPYDACDADALLQQLAGRGFILRYQASGSSFIQIVSFGKHQDPHYKEKASEIPAPPGHVDTGKTAGSASDELRAKILARDGACKHCQSTVDLTLDHIIPRSKGGSHEEENLQTLCRRCNSAKNNREARPIIGQSSANDQGGKSPLIPSSLIPDSSPLIPDSLKPERAQSSREPESRETAEALRALLEAEGHKPTPAGAICKAMKAAGLQAVNPGDPRLLAMIAQGATTEEFVGAATDAVAKQKGFAWALTALAGKRTDAQALKLAPPADGGPTAWHETQGGVDAMASRLGLPKWDGCTPWRGFRKTIVEAAEAARIAA